VALLEPLTLMNDAGRSVGPARGAYRLPLERVLVIHDEIDLPFGEVRTRSREQSGARLLTLHNLTFIASLMVRLREAIVDGHLAEVASALREGR
jgi:hypothetical protein